VDPSLGQTYYYNSETGETSWGHPAADEAGAGKLLAGWLAPAEAEAPAQEPPPKHALLMHKEQAADDTA